MGVIGLIRINVICEKCDNAWTIDGGSSKCPVCGWHVQRIVSFPDVPYQPDFNDELSGRTCGSPAVSGTQSDSRGGIAQSHPGESPHIVSRITTEKGPEIDSGASGTG